MRHKFESELPHRKPSMTPQVNLSVKNPEDYSTKSWLVTQIHEMEVNVH